MAAAVRTPIRVGGATHTVTPRAPAWANSARRPAEAPRERPISQLARSRGGTAESRNVNDLDLRTGPSGNGRSLRTAVEVASDASQAHQPRSPLDTRTAQRRPPPGRLRSRTAARHHRTFRPSDHPHHGPWSRQPGSQRVARKNLNVFSCVDRESLIQQTPPCHAQNPEMRCWSR
jgi:hypothetical protein